MVEAKVTSVYTPSEAEKLMITRHLGEDAIVDGGYKENVVLKKEEAERRVDLVSNIEYDF